MRKRAFRPTLGDPLEVRIVPDGSHAVVLTTNTYANALNSIHRAVNTYIASDGSAQATQAYLKSLRQVSKTIPYGAKNLLPSLVETSFSFTIAHQRDQLGSALADHLQSYIETNIEGGAIKYIQSNAHHGSDRDIPTSGHVPKGVKK